MATRNVQTMRRMMDINRNVEKEEEQEDKVPSLVDICSSSIATSIFKVS